MSSAAYLKANDDPISREDWLAFCERHEIKYSPRTMGRNVFYWQGQGGIEILFGEPSYADLPMLASGQLDFSKAEPPTDARRITVSTFYGGDIESVGIMACLLWLEWDLSMSADSEVQWAIMRGVADAVDRRRKETRPSRKQPSLT